MAEARHNADVRPVSRPGPGHARGAVAAPQPQPPAVCTHGCLFPSPADTVPSSRLTAQPTHHTQGARLGMPRRGQAPACSPTACPETAWALPRGFQVGPGRLLVATARPRRKEARGGVGTGPAKTPQPAPGLGCGTGTLMPAPELVLAPSADTLLPLKVKAENEFRFFQGEMAMIAFFCPKPTLQVCGERVFCSPRGVQGCMAILHPVSSLRFLQGWARQTCC